MVLVPKFEALEDRIVLDAVPDVAIDVPGVIDIGAQDVPATLTFDNTGTDSGYLPYVDFVIPTTGEDGDDGVTFDSASFLGAPITTTEIVFDGAGQAVHPLATDALGNPLIVNAADFGAQAGDTLVVFQLPYGSFSPGNPAIDIDVILDFSENADLDQPFQLSALGGFAFGEDALDDPLVDPPIRGAIDNSIVNQQLFEVSKTSTIPENEAANGPSYPYTYTVTVDVADGQTLDTFTLTDTLPHNIVYLGNLNIVGGTGATVTTEPPVNTLVAAGDDSLVIDFATVSDTVTVTFDFYVAETDSDTGAPVINPTSGAAGTIVNQATGTGNWDPIDPRDPEEAVTDSATDIDEVAALNVQKGVAVFNETGVAGPTPGDVYEFTLNVQVSDYFTMGDLVIDDVLGNGWAYVPGSASFTTVEEGQSITVAEDFAGNLDVDIANFLVTGETNLTFDLSQAMIDAGQDGFLTGDVANDGSSSGTQTTVEITYRAIIRQALTDPGGGNTIPNIGQGDSLSNSVDIQGNVFDNTTGIATGGTVTDESAAGISAEVGAIREKTVAAVNGAAFDPSIPISAGDEITFSIIYDAPLGSFDDLSIVDNLPQNVFDALEVTTFYEPGAGPAIPPAGQATYGPQDTFFTNLPAPALPGLSTNGPDNQIDFNLDGLNVEPRQAVVVEILFTVTVQDALFSPELLLTNQSTAFEGNVLTGTVDTTAIAQFIYAEPVLEITKGVVSFDPAPNPDVNLPTPGPVAFTPPGSAGARFGGTINSSNLDTAPIDSDITGIDAADTVTFAIVVENTGLAPNGAFDVEITDTLPAGFTLTPGGGNLSVTDGTGAAVAFTGDLFAGGITLTDPPPAGGIAQGAISAARPFSGENIIVITYDAVASNTVVPGQVLTNTASVPTYAALEGGIDRVPFNNLTDTASATIDDPTITKTLKSRQFTDDGSITGRAGNEVVVGENVEFTIRVDIPEAQYFDVVITDRVTAGGLVLQSAVIDTSPVAFTPAQSNATLAGNVLTFNLGDFVNPDDNDLTNDFIEITVTARIDDVAGFDAGDQARNVGRFEFATTDGGPRQNIQGGNNVFLTEPNLTLDKEGVPDVVEAGDTVNYTIDIDNIIGPRDAPAFDLTVSDTLQAPEISLNPGSIQVFLNGVLQAYNGTDYALTTNVGGNPNAFEVFIDRIDPGQNIEIRYSGDVLQSIDASREIVNTADLVYDSTPEDDSTDPGGDGDDRDYSLSDTETLISRAPAIDKSVVAGSTDYDETTGTDLGIGEVVTYEIIVGIPEGLTDAVVLSDTLPAGLEYVTSEVIRIGANISGPQIGAGPLLGVGDEGVNVGQVTSFDLGNLTNAFDGTIDADDEIVVQITARLTAAGSVSTLDTLTNTGRLAYVDGQGGARSVTDVAQIDVVEPDMSITKDVTPVIADAGDTVSYTIEATNDGDGPAYDMVISDDLVGTAVTADQGSVVISLFDDLGGVYTPPEAPSFSFNGAGELSVIVPVLPAGYVVEITYDATVEDPVTFSTAYTNTAEVTRYDSNPDGDTVTGPADPDAEERVYDSGLAGYVIPQATATFSTPDVTLDKAYLSSSNADTADAAGATPADLVVGETVTYELTITIPQGTADLVLTDVMPTGLIAQSASVVSLDGALSSNLTAGSTDADANITLTAGSVAFDFGTVTLAGTDDAALADTQIVVSVTALVDDVLPQVADGLTLTNTATLDVSDPNGGAPLQPPVIATENVNVVEPELVVDKTGPIGADPTDVVTYTITVENTGTGPAYDAIISDPLADPFLSLVGGTINVVHSAGTVIPPADITENAFAGDGFTVEGLTLLPGQTVTVTFDVLLDEFAPLTSTFLNTATVDYDTVDDGDPNSPTGRPGTDSDDHLIATSPQIAKTPFSSNFAETNSDSPTDVPFDLAVGEQVTYRYTIILPEIPMDQVLVTDTLPAGFEYVSFSVGSTGGLTGANLTTPTVDNSGAPNIVSFDFGAVNNPTTDGPSANDEIILFVTALVGDDPANSAGADRTNSVDLDVDPAGPTPNFNTQTATSDVRIVEPELEIDKTGPLALGAGQSGTFTIVVENSGPNVVPSASGPAYDVTIADVLPAEMTLDAGPITVLVNGVATAPDSEVRGPTGFTLGFDVLDVNDVVTITYNATLDAGAAPLGTFQNTATANYDGVPGTPADPADQRVYAPVSDDHVIATNGELSKTPTASSLSETGSGENDPALFDLAIGEEVTYDLVLTLPDIAMDSVQLVDTLPAGLEFVSAAFVSTSDDVAINGATTINDVGQVVTFTFGDVTNDLSGSDANEITVQITARVRDVAGNVDATVLTNSAGMVITPQGEAALPPVVTTANVEVVEPALTLDKTGDAAVSPGEEVNYTLTLVNTGTAPAFDVIIEDTLGNPFLSLVSGSVTIDLGGDITANVDVTETATGFIFELDDNVTGDPIPVGVGQTLIVEYRALLDVAAPSAQSFVNTATADYDSLPGDPVDGGGAPIDDRDYSTQDDYAVATVPFLIKTPTASDFPETGEAPFELGIGETIEFTYELYLPEIAMSEVTFFDDLPDGMDFVSFTVVSTGDMTDFFGGAVTPPVSSVVGNDLTLVFSDINNPQDTSPPTIGPDDIITITVTAVVTDTASAGQTLTNQATLDVTPDGGTPLNQTGATSSVAVVEPELSVDKTGPLGANPGDVVPFEIVIENSHPSGATGPAYDVSIMDALPPEFSLATGSLTFTSDQRGVLAPASLTATTAGFDATFDVLLSDEVLTITYNATLDVAAPPAESFANTVTVNYDSAPGANPEQQVYAPEVDDHRVATIPQLSKTITGTNIPQTGTGEYDPAVPDVAIGELITYDLVLTLPEVDGQLVVLTDTLPAGLEFVSSVVTAVGNEIIGVTLGDTGLGSVAGQVVTFDFGTVNNSFETGAADEGVINAEDQITLQVVVRVADVAAAVDGAQLTNDARLNVELPDGFIFDEQQDDAVVDVVEPSVIIDKTVSDDNPTAGDTITYTVVLTNEATATGPAFNLVITDALPDDLSLAAPPRLSDPALGTTLSGTGAETLVVSVPVLLPGETLTVEYDVFVGFATPVLQPIVNTAEVLGSTSPTGPGRPLVDDDTAEIEVDPAPTGGPTGKGEPTDLLNKQRPPGLGIDDAQFLPILLIDPIFSGTAEPGSNVTATLYRQDGSMSYVRNIVADAGGHWIAIFPSVEFETVQDPSNEFFDRSVLFEAPYNPLDDLQRDSIGAPVAQREVTIGSLLNDEGYSITLQQDRPSTLPQDAGMYNARTFFNPATVGEGYGVGNVLKVDEVFEEIAGLTVARLYDASADPLGVTLNRFNYEFLSESTALPGSAR